MTRRFAVVTLFPEMLTALTAGGVVGRALADGLLALETVNPREFATDRHKSVDDRPYGGGPGMVMKPDVLAAAIRAARQRIDARHVVLLSPQGERLDQAGVEGLSEHDRLVLVAGRYEGLDERVVDAHVDQEVSIGDYVLSGGELPAMVLIDALARRVPGVLGDTASATYDSFATGLLDHPHYTRPERFDGRDVPAVLTSGDHGAIERWRLAEALERTWRRRPDLVARRTLSAVEWRLLNERLTARDAAGDNTGEV